MGLRSEVALIGSLLVDPDAIIEVAPLVDVEDFTDRRAAAVYAAVLRLHRSGRRPDYVLVCEEMESVGDMPRISETYLISAISQTPSSLRVTDYAATVSRSGGERRGITHRTPLKGSVRV